MGTERQVEVTPNQNNLITCVPLFHYGPSGIIESKNTYEGLSGFTHLKDVALNHWNNKITDTEALLTRQRRTAEQINGQITNFASHISCGTAYLYFLDQLEDQGLSKHQIFDFFKLCLAVNTESSERVEYSRTGVEEAFMRQSAKSRKLVNLSSLLNKASGHMPDWFHDSSEKYIQFLHDYSSFQNILHPKLKEMSTNQRIAFYKAEVDKYSRGEKSSLVWGATNISDIPDWVDEKELPVRKQVEEELAADILELELLEEESSRIIKSSNFIRQSVNDKGDKLQDWLRMKWMEVKLDNPKLGDFLSYLHLNIYDDREKSIQYYIGLDERIFDSEAMALWIESNLKTAGVIADNNLAETDRLTLAPLFDGKLSWDSFKNTHRKGYNALHFNLEPFVRLLTGEDISLLGEFLDEEGSGIGYFISFFADCVTARLTEQENGLENQRLNIAIREFRQFYKKFLKTNWPVLFEQFQTVIFDKSAFAEPDSIQEFRSENEDPIGAARELEEELAPLKEDPLSGWRVFYSTDQTSKNASLSEVTGSSLDEKEISLQQILVRERALNSIKKSSIANSIAWKTQVPKEVEIFTPAIVVKGERWKKIKRQNVRILYQMDLDNRTFVFFLHQKQDWSYNLPA